MHVMLLLLQQLLLLMLLANMKCKIGSSHWCCCGQLVQV
jgi:hypothetical protein